MSIDIDDLEPGTLVMLLPRTIVNNIEHANNSDTEDVRSAAMLELEHMGGLKLRGSPYVRSLSDPRNGHMVSWGSVAFYVGLRRQRQRADKRSSSYTRAHSVRRPVFFVNGTQVVLDLTQCVELNCVPKTVIDCVQQNLNDN